MLVLVHCDKLKEEPRKLRKTYVPQKPCCEQHSLLFGQIPLPVFPPPHEPYTSGVFGVLTFTGTSTP